MAEHLIYVPFRDNRSYTDNLMAVTFLKDPSAIDNYYVVWCSPNGTNDAGTGDTGRLQSETLSTSTWTAPTGITASAGVKTAVTIRGVVYGENTVATVGLTGGTVGSDYDIVNKITTATRTLEHTITIKVRNE